MNVSNVEPIFSYDQTRDLLMINRIKMNMIEARWIGMHRKIINY